MLRALSVVLVLALSLAFAGSAQAVLITVNFIVTTATGSGSGSFTVDNSGFESGGYLYNDAAIQSFDLTYGASSWDETKGSLGTIQFDASGHVVDFQFFGDVNGVSTYISGTGDFVLDTFFPKPDGEFYADSPLGTIQWQEAGNAPEPASWALVSGALVVGLVRVRRRVRN